MASLDSLTPPPPMCNGASSASVNASGSKAASNYTSVGKDALGNRIVIYWGQRALATGGKAALSGMLSQITGGNLKQSVMQSLLSNVASEVVSALKLQVATNPNLSTTKRTICNNLVTAVGSAHKMLINCPT